VVFRGIERGEVEPVRLNLWALGHFKAHRGKNPLNALQGQRHRVQAPLATLAARQSDIQALGLQLHLQLGLGQGIAALGQGRFNGLLGHVDGSAPGFLLFYGQLRHALHQLGHLAGFAQKLGFGVFQLNRGSRLREQLAGAGNQGIQFVHSDFDFACDLAVAFSILQYSNTTRASAFSSPSPC